MTIIPLIHHTANSTPPTAHKTDHDTAHIKYTLYIIYIYSWIQYSYIYSSLLLSTFYHMIVVAVCICKVRYQQQKSADVDSATLSISADFLKRVEFLLDLHL